MNTKKIIALFMVCTLLCTIFAGCAKKDNAETGMPNPMTEVTVDDMPVYVCLPYGAEDTKYFTIDDGTEYLIYQASFTFNGHEYTYRIQETNGTDAYDMSGLNYDNWDTAPDMVDFCDGIVGTNDKAAFVYWIDIVPGINYTLSCNDPVSYNDILDMANMVFVSTQEADEPEGEPVDIIYVGTPDEAENLTYSSEGKRTTLTFDFDGSSFVYIAEYTDRTEAYDMSEENSIDWNTETADVRGCEATIRTCDTCSLVFWYDTGVNYTLVCNGSISSDALIAIASETFSPVAD